MTSPTNPPLPASSGTTPAVPRRRPPGRTPPLFSGALAALAGGVLYFSVKAQVAESIHLWLGLAMLVLATLPALRWAKQADYRFPVFEVFMLTGVNTYAIPLLSGHQQLRQFTPQDITAAAIGVVLYQTVANIVFALVRARPRTSRAWTQEVVSGNISDYLRYGMLVATAYTMINLFTEWIPPQLDSVVRAACFGVGIISTFIQSRMWGQGQLSPQAKVIFVTLLLTQVVFSWVALYLVGGASILVLAFIGYVSGSKKLPLVALALAVPVVAILHNGKNIMREKYWQGELPLPSLAEVPAFYVEWFRYGIDPAQVEQRERENNLLLERTSLFHILCLVVTYTPERQPYLHGKTYGQIPGQFVPRFLWPEKPVAHISTNTLSVYYGLQREEDTLRTTIAFGTLSEAYANFGYAGLMGLAAVFAFCFRKVSDWCAHSPMLSYAGLFQVVLMAWSFQSELTLSVWLSSLFQACVTVLGLPFVLRRLLGQ